jgi:hypothetical protein
MMRRSRRLSRVHIRPNGCTAITDTDKVASPEEMSVRVMETTQTELDSETDHILRTTTIKTITVVTVAEATITGIRDVASVGTVMVILHPRKTRLKEQKTRLKEATEQTVETPLQQEMVLKQQVLSAEIHMVDKVTRAGARRTLTATRDGDARSLKTWNGGRTLKRTTGMMA